MNHYKTFVIFPKCYTRSLQKISSIQIKKEKACHIHISTMVACSIGGSPWTVLLGLHDLCSPLPH